jgi:hypothetical protein
VRIRPFPRSEGSKWVSVPLLSTVDNLELTKDSKRTAKFLEVKLVADQGAERRRAWTLKVRVRPNMADGPFPRAEDPAYEDCAVYLRAREKGKPVRHIRIPVAGTATAG